MRAHVINRDHIGVIERGRDPRLLQEPGPEHIVGGQFRRQHLQRHRAAQPRILRLINHAHPAPAQHSPQPVTSELISHHRQCGHHITPFRRTSGTPNTIGPGMGSAPGGGDAPWRSVARQCGSLPRATPARISGPPEIELRLVYASGTACTMRGGGQVACSGGRGGLASGGGARAEDRGWCPPRTTWRFRSSRMWRQVLGSNKRGLSRRLTDRLALPLPMVAQLPNSRPPRSPPPARQPPRRNPARLPQNPYPLRRNHRLGPPQFRSCLTFKTWDVCRR